MSNATHSRNSPFPTSLLIDVHLDRVVAGILEHPVSVLGSPPGSGKTTHLPLAIAARLNPQERVWVLEPRRIAARLAAGFAASERSCELGSEVGYHFRRDRKESKLTRVLYLTEGMMLRRARDLEDATTGKTGAVRVVLLDEFHERHTQTDTAWAYLRHLQTTRMPELRICLLSATLDFVGLKRAVPNLHVQTVEGPTYPLTLLHEPELSLAQAYTRVRGEKLARGSTLIFLPGKREIENARQELQQAGVREPIEVLHGSLDAAEQTRITAPALTSAGQTPERVILTTNLAESSVTVAGVNRVIDTGTYRQAHESPWTQVPSLKTRPITQASAIQRAGRAARQGPGIALRLYAREDYTQRLPFETPEIGRSDLAHLLLDLKLLGVDSPQALPWLETLPESRWKHAWDRLVMLGLLEATSGAPTPLAQALANLSLPLRPARLALESLRASSPETAERVLALALAWGEDSLPSGEIHWERMRASSELIARSGIKSLSRDATAALEPKTSHTLVQALLQAAPDSVAKRKSQDAHQTLWITALGAELELKAHPPSTWIIPLSVLETDRGRPRINAYITMHEDDLLSVESSTALWSTVTRIENESGRLMNIRTERFGAISLSETRSRPEPGAELAQVLARAYLDWAQGVPEARADLESHWVRGKAAGLWDCEPSEIWKTGLLQLMLPLCQNWQSTKDVEQYGPHPAWAELWAESMPDRDAQQALRALRQKAPAQVDLPGRSNVPVRYSLTEPPTVESRLQDFMGLAQTPWPGFRLVLLAPNYRPVQVTSDLASFWKTTYPEIRTQLMRRYPRHPWPEETDKPCKRPPTRVK